MNNVKTYMVGGVLRAVMGTTKSAQFTLPFQAFGYKLKKIGWDYTIEQDVNGLKVAPDAFPYGWMALSIISYDSTPALVPLTPPAIPDVALPFDVADNWGLYFRKYKRGTWDIENVTVTDKLTFLVELRIPYATQDYNADVQIYIEVEPLPAE